MRQLPHLSRLPLLAALAAAVLAAATLSAGAQGKAPNPVKATAEASKPDDKGVQTVTVTVTVEKPYHLYANPVGNKDLEATQTVLKFTSKNQEVIKIEYPEGKEVKDKTVGDYRIYEEKLVIKATVKRATNAAGPLEMELGYQACTDKDCLPPGKAKLSVP